MPRRLQFLWTCFVIYQGVLAGTDLRQLETTTDDDLHSVEQRFVLVFRSKLPCNLCFGHGVNISSDPRCQFGCRRRVLGRGRGSGSGAIPSTVTSSTMSTKLSLISHYSATGGTTRAKNVSNAGEINANNVSAMERLRRSLVSALKIGSAAYPSPMKSPEAKYHQSNVDGFINEFWRVVLFSLSAILLVIVLILILRSRKAICRRRQSVSSQQHQLSMNL